MRADVWNPCETSFGLKLLLPVSDGGVGVSSVDVMFAEEFTCCDVKAEVVDEKGSG